MGAHRWAARGAEPGRFSTALSVSADALASAGQLVPLVPVIGADLRSVSIALPLPRYRQPPFVASPRPDQEFVDDVRSVDALDEQVTAARHRAYGQLREQAARLGADAVINVRRIGGTSPGSSPGRIDLARTATRLRPGPHPYLLRTVECQLMGTAVRDPTDRSTSPRCSTVSAADFWRLRQGGWRVVGVVGGCAHRFGASLWVDSVGHEIQGSTAVWSAARQAALAQLRRELEATDADGVIAITTEAVHERFEWTEPVEVLGLSGRTRTSRVARRGLLVSIEVLGTAVARVTAAARGDVAMTRTIDLS